MLMAGNYLRSSVSIPIAFFSPAICLFIKTAFARLFILLNWCNFLHSSVSRGILSVREAAKSSMKSAQLDSLERQSYLGIKGWCSWACITIPSEPGGDTSPELHRECKCELNAVRIPRLNCYLSNPTDINLLPVGRIPGVVAIIF